MPKISERVLERRRALSAVTNGEDALARADAAVVRAEAKVAKAKADLEAAEKAVVDAQSEAGGQKAALVEAKEHLIRVTGLQVVPDEPVQDTLPDTI